MQQSLTLRYAPSNINWELIDNAIFQLLPCCHISMLPLSNFINAIIASLDSCKVSILISKRIAHGAPRFLLRSPGTPYGAL